MLFRSGENMRRELVILLVLCSVFLATGCAEQGGDNATQAGEGGANEERVTPAEEPVVPAEESVTPNPEETPEIPIGDGKNVEVTIKDNAFNPAIVNISAGDTVRWTNLDSTTHTVVSTGGTYFKSENLNQGDSYEFLFTDPGTYEYYCEIHPSMKGTVVVTEEE